MCEFSVLISSVCHFMDVVWGFSTELLLLLLLMATSAHVISWNILL